MANKEIWTDLDGVKVGILRNWRLNPLTTVQRTALGITLDASHSGLHVFDTDFNSPFFWNGVQWISPQAVPAPSSDTYTGIAGEVLGGGRLVYLKVGKFFLYDADNTSLAGSAFGMTKTAANIDSLVDIQVNGIFTEVGMGLTPYAEYYASTNGLLTLNPTNNVITSVGIAITADKLKLGIHQSIITI